MQIANEFGALSEDLDRLNGKLKALDPPSELKDELRDLNDGLDEAVDSLEGIEAAARARKAAKARTETARFVAISRDINEAQNKLADATGADKGAS